ncbi:MAG: elongation factor Ts [Proteobacteria bacterium]|nr:translation elongation factor Ts [Gammaproteobacteria bacterium]MYB88448.1 elongation factor Ts [Pseudomonadota bacterium]
MQITATLVKELRERTGAGMMECKKALQESSGDIDAAIEQMRKIGQAKADKKASRIAADGMVALATSADGKQASLVEVNCETDFVAKDKQFQAYCTQLAGLVLGSDIDTVEALGAATLESGLSAEQARLELVTKIGENIRIRRLQNMRSEHTIAGYLHGNRIGVLVDYSGGDATLGKDVAMHIAASRPACVSEDDVDEEVLAKERGIFQAQAESSGKPENIIEKIVEGRVKKFLKEITLLGQPFVKDPDQSVGQLLKSADATVAGFVRFEVGEGLEKRSDNFVDEVMGQVKQSED